MDPTTGEGRHPTALIDEAHAKVLEEFRGHEGELISILVRMQDHFGYLSRETIAAVARFLRLTENHVFGVASFFSKFRFSEPGKTAIKVCMGTACHVHGGGLLSDSVGWHLGVSFGQATRDRRFDFQRVNCLGCCALAPVVQVDENIHGRTMLTELKKVLGRHD